MLILKLMNSGISIKIAVPVLDFNEARDDGMAVASAGPYANYLHYASDR